MKKINEEQLYNNTSYEKLTYPQQLAHKQTFVERLFKDFKVNPIIINPNPKHYRHKAVLSAVNKKVSDKLYKIQLGLYKEGTRNVVPNLNHFLHDPMINACFQVIEEVFHQFKIRAYHPNDRHGIIKHVMIKKSFYYQELMVVIVTMGNLLPNAKDLCKALVTKCPHITTIVQNIHDKESHLVILDKEKVLYGDGFIKDRIEDLDFRISAKAFYQVNPRQMFNLYDKTLKIAKLSHNSEVIDAYCGIGTISLLAAKQAKHVTAIDINAASIKDAIFNKKMNKIENVDFINADVEDYILGYNKKVDVLIMDPTREGASEKFLQAVLKLAPQKIVYISCEPHSQIRDIRILSKNYQIKEIQPVDMFSYTTHVENIVLLEKKRVK